jgi:hypothetical protein
MVTQPAALFLLFFSQAFLRALIAITPLFRLFLLQLVQYFLLLFVYAFCGASSKLSDTAG